MGKNGPRSGGSGQPEWQWWLIGVRVTRRKCGSGGGAARAFVVEVSEVGWGADTHFPACVDAGDLFFRKACGSERGGPGWGHPDVSVKRC
jgi:hypothetical protein